ncbi:hypothetical protein PH586_21390 [Pseudomonas sp. SA3-5]|uniref:Uncharacterized protein n=1 Tax=Pseudomonas aestuarii TaxID=3018340 RepID=A0ABT4XL42_9PSED|nr:hypothetical protein [Pseudomonas aestuarii]MDA7088939.1 hypothetical protein [Pseudomonas aestuarii]
MKYSKYAQLIMSAFIFPITAQAETVAERYPGPWEYEFNFEMTRALTKAEVGSCGHFKYRASSMDRGEYLVYCTSDSENWTAYMVWPNIEKVLGPYQIDESLNE